MQREIERTAKERQDQKKRYETDISLKEQTITCKSVLLTNVVAFEKSNTIVRQEIADMKSRLRLEEVEAELQNIKATNA